MRLIPIFIFLLFFLFNTKAYCWEYELKDAIIEKIDDEGNKSHSVNMQVIDYYLNRISTYARSYPPKFENEEIKQNVVAKLKQLIGTLEIIGQTQQNNPGFLSRAAFANSMGHNLDLENSDEQAISYYQKLLKIDPDNPVNNYQYGMFLSGTKKYHFESIPFLEKALEFGQKDAGYTLGLLYFHQGHKEKGIKTLQTYSSENPNNEHVLKIIEAIKSGELKFESS